MVPTSRRLIRNIRYFVVTQNWTYMALAEKLGVCHQTIGAWASGSRNPTFYHVDRLADAFGVDPVELFKERR